ncbi:PTS glucose transporter subunit IIA [Paenibacillus sp. M1]|uniref:PTS glucose transporter subunit IIA n=1 Tax=Paenibacillus haidiansis TaxID=1574488 RepID=A0ABU7VPZ8_9BACL
MFGFRKKAAEPAILEIASPIQGTILSLDNVEDEAFSSRAMGEGIAIEPHEGKVVAPFSGKLVHLMEKSKHAMILEHDSGVQILIHVGMNTVSLKGEGFIAHASSGDRITKGQLLLEFDIAAIQEAGYPVVTPIIVPGGQEIIKQVDTSNPHKDAIIKVTY